MAGAPTSWKVVVIFWFLIIAVTYAAFELGVRAFAPRVTEVTEELDRALVEIKEKHSSIAAFVTERKKPKDYRAHVHPVLGWDREMRHHSSCESSCKRSFRVLLLGNSVTAGQGVEVGLEDYGYLLSQLPADDGIEVYNAAVSGYGIDQMLEKAKLVGNAVQPDLIIFAYIAHDLLRSGRNYLYLLTRPGLALNNGQLEVTPPGDLTAYIQRYADYRDSYRSGLWLLSFFWQNRRYYAPYLYREFFATVFAEVAAGMTDIAETNGAQLAFVMLPQSFTFRNHANVVALMGETLQEFGATSSYPFRIVDIHECVQQHLIANNLDMSTMRFHPPAAGHRAYADCMAKLVLQPAISTKKSN